MIAGEVLTLAFVFAVVIMGVYNIGLIINKFTNHIVEKGTKKDE